MESYFPDLETSTLQWCIQPFTCHEDQVKDNDFPAKEEFVALRMSQSLKLEFQEKS